MSENVLTIENATMQFGGVVAVDNLNLKVDKDRSSPHRPQRCRQDHRVQRCHRRVCAHQRRGVVRGTQDH